MRIALGGRHKLAHKNKAVHPQDLAGGGGPGAASPPVVQDGGGDGEPAGELAGAGGAGQVILKFDCSIY